MVDPLSACHAFKSVLLLQHLNGFLMGIFDSEFEKH